MSTPKKRVYSTPTGRPTKYLPEYCDMIIEAGRSGKTMVHFACEIGVSKDTLNEWASKHKEFSDAFRICKTLNEQYWLNQAQSRAEGLHQGSDAIIKFMLSAAHGYREKTDVVSEVTADVTNTDKVQISFVDLKP